MGVMLEEQEIVINASRTNPMASIYVTDRRWITKMDKKVVANPQQFRVKEVHRQLGSGEIIGKTYEFPAKFISIRSKEVKRDLTDEERKKIADRFRKIRNSEDEVPGDISEEISDEDIWDFDDEAIEMLEEE